MKKYSFFCLLLVTVSFVSAQTLPALAPPLNFAISSAIDGHPHLIWDANPLNPSYPTVYYKIFRLIQGSGYTSNLIPRGVWLDVQTLSTATTTSSLTYVLET